MSTWFRGPRVTRDDSGVAAVVTALFLAGLFFALAAISVDVSRWYVEVERVQKAADAGSLAGVTYMPQDFSSATSAAIATSTRNGYPDGGKTGVIVKPGQRPSQLQVTVTSRIPNTFGALFGHGSITIARSATADYTGPAPMGSPCNTFGNEPLGGETSVVQPKSSQLAAPPGATCPQFPLFWASIASPEVAKTQGDQYATRWCLATEGNCTGDVNKEFDPQGYFFIVHVGAAAVGRDVTVQLYDPATVLTGSLCEYLPVAFALVGQANDYTADANQRYSNLANNFCPGDADNYNFGIGLPLRKSNASTNLGVTSFALRSQVDTYNPRDSTPVAGCTRQYPGYTYPTVGNLTKGAAGYNDDLARVFHHWKTLCTFRPTRAGDYYLQVRSNVALQGAVNDDGSYLAPNASTSKVFTQSGDDTSLNFNTSNRFSMRAFTDGGASTSLAVSAYEKMPIFANADSSAPTFNLIRVLPGAAGKTLEFTFHDVGDAAANGTMTVLRPTEATGAALSNCRATGYSVQTLPACSLSGISAVAGWDGKQETISVPIPSNYNCDYTTSGGCWFRVRVSFGTGSVHDATTWSATINGDPVRLVQ